MFLFVSDSHRLVAKFGLEASGLYIRVFHYPEQQQKSTLVMGQLI